MRANMVVMMSPALDGVPCVRQIKEQIFVQAVFSEFAVEALHKGVLGRLAGLDEVKLDLVSSSPEEHRLGSELRAIVKHQGLGQCSGTSELIQIPSQSFTPNGCVHDLANTFAGEVIDQVKDADPPPAGQLIGHEVSRPALIGLGGHWHGHTGTGELLAALGHFFGLLR